MTLYTAITLDLGSIFPLYHVERMLDASLLYWTVQTVEHFYVVSVLLSLSYWLTKRPYWLLITNDDFITNANNTLRRGALRPEGRWFESLFSASAWNSDTVSVLCQERFWAVVDLMRRYRNIQNEWIIE